MKNNYLVIPLLLISISLVGCAAKLEKQADLDVCTRYYRAADNPFASKDKFEAELKRRELIDNWEAVKSGKVQPGMTECELFATWGYPGSPNNVIREQTSSGEPMVTKFYHFPGEAFQRGSRDVTVVNGKVDSISTL